ncbi:MAG: hypothetical protein OXM02_01430 [Bacteroidota bacterium]|nr:hypothetical protein [Bacteroidota bacterium]MDE2833168.1 hypothetical protein [Bacteroidota bacterium]MDE2957595.1 hypothetical protein [Bacteroidota bacterium]
MFGSASVRVLRLLALLLVPEPWAHMELNEPIPVDRTVTIGALGNGITY